MDPKFQKLLMLLMMKQKMGASQKPKQGAGKVNQNRAIQKYKKGGDISDTMTPNAAKLMHQLKMAYLNPGGGWMGNDTVGGGQVFGGFFRGDPRFKPDRSPSGLEGTKPNVGYTGFMRGDAPGMTDSASQSWNRLHENLNDPVGVRIGQGWTPERLQEEGWMKSGGNRMSDGMEDFFRGVGGMGFRDSMGPNWF